MIPFITAGDPSPQDTVRLLHVLVESGADLIELGIPFSDPMADGPVIQKASERALVHGTSLTDVLTMVKEFRQENTNTPIILMGYLNPIEIMGYEKFSKNAQDAGVDGILIVDLPPEEADDLKLQLENTSLSQVYLLSPTTTNDRIERICKSASGFLYYVSLKGVTGSNQLDVTEVEDKIRNIQSKTNLPVGVGFGIKDANSAQKVAQFCDAVIVGSALVELIGKGGNIEKIIDTVSGFMKELRIGIDHK